MSVNSEKKVWFTLVTVRGSRVSMNDAKLIGGRLSVQHNEITKKAPSKKEALKMVEAVKGKLSQQYVVLMYTDRQHSRRDSQRSAYSVMTLPQCEKAFFIQ